MRSFLVFGVLGLVVACGDDSVPLPFDAGGGEEDAGVVADAAPDAGPVDAGPTCTEWLAGSELAAWPDDSLLVRDDSTATGWRLAFDEARFPDTVERLSGFAPVFTEDLPTLDGFGNNAQAYFRFGRAFDMERVPSGGDPGLGFVVLSETPYLQPVLVEATDEDTTLMMAPMRPLPEQTWAAAYVTRALTDAAGGCLEPPSALTDRLGDPDEETQAALDALRGLGAIEEADDLVALTVFPVQTITTLSRAIAADIATRDYVLEDGVTCTDGERFRQCETSFVAVDYRDEDHVLRQDPEAVEAERTYELPITIWLPLEGEGPFPTIVWGSGLGSGRGQGRRLAEFAAPAGFATIAIDPVTHGEHPDVGEDDATTVLPTAIRFFTIGDLRTRAIRPLQLRDNWRQSAYDKLQLVRLLLGGVDVDGDESADLETENLTYLGVSLGGIMGPEPLALTDSFSAAVLVVPGGRVSSIMSAAPLFRDVIALLAPRGTTPGDTRRFFPVLQTLLEPGDAASYGAHVIAERFEERGDAPHVLAGVVLDDSTVPNVSNYTLMRAMRLPLVGALLREEPGIGAPVAAPLMGNFDGVTGGFLQFDVVDDGGVEDATHDNVGDSVTGIAAWIPFLESNLEGTAIIVDPYEETGLAHE